jgi:chemotaxis protein methyltransferase WspC
LEQHGPSAQAFFFLGRIRDSQGALQEAMTLFKKSVYLDPDNADGLMQLTLLAERLGDKTGADLFRQRALRIKERGASNRNEPLLNR